MENPWQESPRAGRTAGMLGAAGAAIACVALVLAGLSGAPYISAAGVNGWIVVFAAGLLGALVGFPFGLELRLRGRYAEHEKRWEVALLIWAAVAVTLFALAIVIGFDTGTLAGAAALIAAVETGLVIATIGVWLVSGG